ncbi:MAG TPA: sterol desaturase family protein [Saprospiraceae bacterium]|jgi:sterol desaturase/sphingolipid hydroxylase (fatty acid hydroxylase superfamily)|nr:sterol desaturase family protein [Saprospiraceae bacterium]
MQEYARILNYAIPFFLILIALEYGVSMLMHKQVNRLFDTISSLSSGITNVIKDVLGLSIVIISYGWLVDHLAIYHIQSTILTYVLAFIGIDFAGYWIHRWSHEINVFWNRHIIHHSSEEFNLSCALRQSVSEIFALFTFTYIPMAILGIPAQVVAIVAPIQLFAQFWYHTRLIHKMGWLEYILVTPSHHRVHHAINPEYMDKNYSQIFIIWDKLFGTFQPEKEEIPAVYGVTRAVHTWNPWIINYQHLWLLISDAWRTKSWLDKLKIWVMPTGWRPADVSTAFPVPYTKEIYLRNKYDTIASPLFKVWAVGQLLITLLLMMFLFNNIGTIPFSSVLLYGLFLFVNIFAYTSLMDGNLIGIAAEVLKFALGIIILYINDYQWFNIDNSIPSGTLIVLGYLVLSLTSSVYFYLYEKPKAMVSTVS